MTGALSHRGRLKASLLRLTRSEAGAMLFAFTAATLLIRLGGNVILTRLVDPHAFGVVGVIISVMMVLAMLSDLGFIDFVTRHEKGGDRRFLDILWTIRLGQSALQSVAMLAAAWPIAQLLGKPELALPIAATAPLFLLGALCPMTLLLAQREGRVRAACTVELATLVVQIGVNLTLSLVLPDYRALIIGMYASALIRPIFTLLLIEGRSRPAWDPTIAREFFRFSRWIMASTLLTLLITQSDKFLFARMFSVADFGVYMLPVNLALSLQPFGRNYVDRYFFPLVSRRWREAPDAIAPVFYPARRRFFYAQFGAIGLGIGLAPLLFALLFDPRYEYGWIYFSVLLLRVAFDLDNFATVKTLIAMGRTNLFFRVNLVRLVFVALALAGLFGRLGPIALPLALLVSELAAWIYCASLLRGTGLFRAGEHGRYYAALMIMALPGAAASALLAARVIRAGLAAIG